MITLFTLLHAIPGNRVKIKELENGYGIIDSVNIGNVSISYNVRYWHNGDAKTA